MPIKCVALGCTTSYEPGKAKVSIFSVPKDEDLRTRWQEAIPWKYSVLKPSHRVCENHFREEDILRKVIHRDKDGKVIAEGVYKLPRLKEGAVPTKSSVEPDKDHTSDKDHEADITQTIIKVEGEFELVDIPTVKEEHRVENAETSVNAPIIVKDDINHQMIKVEHRVVDLAPENIFETLMKDPAAVALPSNWARLTPADGGQLVIYTQYISRKVSGILKAVHWKEVVVNENLGIECTVMGRSVNLAECGITEDPIQDIMELEDALRKVDAVRICIGGAHTDEFPRVGGRGNYGKWSQTELQIALAAYRKGNCGLNECARLYKIPKATLKRHLERKNVHANDEHKVMGRPTVFTKEVEDKLVQHLLKFEERQFGLTITDVRRLAFEIAERSSILHSFNKEKRIAGKKWYYAFMARHPELSLRHPEFSSMSRATGANRQKMMEFFGLLKNIADKYKIDSNTIFTIDEYGFSVIEEQPHKLRFMKSRHVGTTAGEETSADMSIVCCVNASGLYIPPMIIFKQKCMIADLGVGAPAESLIEISETGCINSELFVSWLKHFHSMIQSTKERPVLLLLDGNTVHSKTVEVLEFARDNGITLLQLPGNATHRFRPLEAPIFKTLENYFTEEQEKWSRINVGKSISVLDVSAPLSKAYSRAATISNAESAFRVSGIWPVNGNIFLKCQLKASDPLHIEEFHDNHLKSNQSTASTSLDSQGITKPSHLADDHSIAGTSHLLPEQPLGKNRNEIAKRPSTMVLNSELKKTRTEKNTENEDEDDYDWLMHL